MTARRTTAQVIAGLRQWTRHHDPHVQAAVHLLIDHEQWLRDSAFLSAAVQKASDGDVWINWTEAREAFDAGRFSTASATELGILDLAIALGSDRFRLSRMNTVHTQLVARAVGTALGTD
jgi:hypothetical protein